MGRLVDEVMTARVSIYGDDELLDYVRRVGLRVAAQSHGGDMSWTFRILDDPAAQAWAGPNAHIYVTRGLLAVLDSEAELAAVLAHEVGHVVAGHTDAALEQLPDIARTDADWGAAFRLGRDDEAQADQLSVRYLRAAGYDPSAFGRALLAIEAVGQGESWGDRHPPVPVRLALTARAAGGVQRGERGRARYLEQITGIVLGHDQREGTLVGSRFVHERGGFSFAVPGAWTQVDEGEGTASVTRFRARRADERIGLTLAHLSTHGRDSVVATVFRAALDEDSVRTFRLAGYPATEGRLTSSASENRCDARAVIFEAKDGDVYALIVSTNAPEQVSVEDAYAQLIQSVSRETGRTSSPVRLRVRRVRQVTTLADLMRDGCAPAGQEALLVELNRTPLDAPLDPGRSVKCAMR